jgi:hypothetical protein
MAQPTVRSNQIPAPRHGLLTGNENHLPYFLGGHETVEGMQNHGPAGDGLKDFWDSTAHSFTAAGCYDDRIDTHEIDPEKNKGPRDYPRPQTCWNKPRT